MGGIFQRNGYSARAWLLALFVALALILGGGGSPNPSTEVMLEGAFVIFALAWIWLSQRTASSASPDRMTLALIAIPMVIPVVQLVPLPPSIWTQLPGRENAVAALSLVGKESSWRPISLSPSRTLASLLSIVPAMFCLYAVSRLDLHERRLILGAVVLMTMVTSVLGAFQIAAGDSGFNLYPEHHADWVTGFQANRNAAADLLLTGFLALAVLAAPYLVGGRQRHPLGLSRRALSLLTAAAALFILAATVMTGSRTGTLLVLVAGAFAAFIFSLIPSSSPFLLRLRAAAGFAAIATAGLAIVFLVLSETTAVGRVAIRFSDTVNTRGEIWKDAWFALKQYWPVGFGMGGFESAMLPAERLEVLGPAIPNRAHNDFLELGLEAGMLGWAMVAAGTILCLAMAWRAWRDVPGMRRQVIFGLGVLLVVALHSIVDYPLRSMAIACLSGVAAGMLASNRVSADRQSAHGRVHDVKGFA